MRHPHNRFANINIRNRLTQPVLALNDNSIPLSPRERVVSNPLHRQVAPLIWSVCTHKPLGILIARSIGDYSKHKTLKLFLAESLPPQCGSNRSGRPNSNEILKINNLNRQRIGVAKAKLYEFLLEARPILLRNVLKVATKSETQVTIEVRPMLAARPRALQPVRFSKQLL